MLKKVKAFVTNESGQGLVEYAILAALLVVVVIVIVKAVGGSIKNKFSNVNDALQ